jgi:PPOX class probable F420-dependent enzyme
MSEERDAFIREANVAVLASVDSRGRAHAAPVWYLHKAGVFIISTGRGSQKHRNVETNPDITLVIDRRTIPYYAVMARGLAEIGDPLTDAERREMAVRYLGEELGNRYVERTAGQDAITIRLTPRKLIEYQGRAGRAQ